VATGTCHTLGSSQFMDISLLNSESIFSSAHGPTHRIKKTLEEGKLGHSALVGCVHD
jgi:hypothetical protein